MVSMTLFLNRKSKDYRYVIQALEKEKKHLKVNPSLRLSLAKLALESFIMPTLFAGDEKFEGRHAYTARDEVATDPGRFSSAPIKKVPTISTGSILSIGSK